VTCDVDRPNVRPVWTHLSYARHRRRLAFQITPRRFSPPLLCWLPKSNAGSATVLVDELASSRKRARSVKAVQVADSRNWVRSDKSRSARRSCLRSPFGLGDVRLDDRKIRHPSACPREPARPENVSTRHGGSQRHLSFVKVSLWMQFQPR
jgi:hypothetical protein